MPTLPTFDAIRAAFQAEVQSRNPLLTDWNEGSNLDAIGGGASILADEVLLEATQQLAGHFLATAEGAQIDAWQADKFGGKVPRNEASKAIGTVRYTKGSLGASGVIAAGHQFRGTAPDGTVVTVQATASVSVAATETAVNVPCEATDAGPGGNVAEDTVDEAVTVPGWDSGTPTVTNVERFAGGADDEEDEAYKARLRNYYQTLRKGTVDAIAQGALTVPGVTQVTVDESNIEGAEGYVEAFVSDPSGTANSELAALVEDELRGWRAAGVRVQVTASTREEVPVVVTLDVEPGAPKDAMRAQLVEAGSLYVNALRAGQSIEESRLAHIAHALFPDTLVSLALRNVIAADPLTVSGNVAAVAPSASGNTLRVAEGDFRVFFSS